MPEPVVCTSCRGPVVVLPADLTPWRTMSCLAAESTPWWRRWIYAGMALQLFRRGTNIEDISDILDRSRRRVAEDLESAVAAANREPPRILLLTCHHNLVWLNEPDIAKK